MSTALLLLDVDGPLNPYGASRGDVDKHRMPVPYYVRKIMGYRVFLSKVHGPMLLDFAAEHDVELAWATTWEGEANTRIGPVIGLPELPVVDLGWQRKFSGTIRSEHWKFDGVLKFAAGRPLAWFDDDFGYFHKERAWFEAERGHTPTLLHHVDPKVGLRADDLDAVAAWLRSEENR